ncbi:MAG: PAS domain S-box protein [Myxococcaceae bacterium]|nr:PAS domain S-box protein [Myxococcaceae bacterium]
MMSTSSSPPRSPIALDHRRNRKALAATEAPFRMIIESVKDYAIFMLDTDGRVATWNLGAERIKGYSEREIVGEYIGRFYPEPARSEGRPRILLERALREGRAEDEGYGVRKDGSQFWADVVITPMFDDEGRHVGFVKVTRDLTERRRAEERIRQTEERFRLLVDSVKDYAIFMLDREGRVQTWNQGAERIKGFTAEEIIGKSFERFYLPEDVASGKTKKELEIAARDGRFEDEGWRVRKDGSHFWANVVITPLRDAHGELMGFAKVTRDLSDRRRQEEDRLKRAQAEEAIRLRDEFLSIASHELKTPLTALQLQVQWVKEKLKGVAEEKVLARLERAATSTARLTELIETLLDVSRIATGRLELVYSEFDLAESARDVVDRFAETAARAQSPLHYSGAPSLIGCWDRLRIEQVMTNLFSNAIKYGAGGAIDVRVEREGDQAVIALSDEGPGIPPGDQERIFGRFERAVSMRHFGGMGLGLYVTRQIVEAHGGTVTVRNLPEKGACFTVRLPLERPSSQAPGC